MVVVVEGFVEKSQGGRDAGEDPEGLWTEDRSVSSDSAHAQICSVLECTVSEPAHLGVSYVEIRRGFALDFLGNWAFGWLSLDRERLPVSLLENFYFDFSFSSRKTGQHGCTKMKHTHTAV